MIATHLGKQCIGHRVRSELKLHYGREAVVVRYEAERGETRDADIALIREILDRASEITTDYLVLPNAISGGWTTEEVISVILIYIFLR